jgi:hypothetical protein
MTEESKILLEVHEEEFKNYKSFIDTNNWFDDVRYNPRKKKLESSLLNTEASIIDTIIKSTTKFKEDVGDDIDKKPIQNFIKFTSTVINKHIDRIAQYKRMYPIQNVLKDREDLEDEDDELSIESEVEFHSDLFALMTKTKVALSKLKIDENELSRKSIDLFFGNSKAPLFMREYLCDTFPIIKDKTENLGIDFSAAHINPATSNELLINMKAKDIPKWDQNKHFFEQEKSTIQFWEEERKKIMHGVNIGGYHLSNWLYWHLNIFKMAFGDEFDKDVKNPWFRDNEFFFDYMYNKAKTHGRRGVFMYGTRRFAKSAGMTSRLMHTMWIVKNAQGTIQGFSEVPDLKAIVTYADTHIQYMYPALKIPANSLTLDDGIVLGLKGKKVQDRYDFANLTIINLEGGTTKRGSQKTAGATPDAFLLDEAGKGACIAPWKAALPSFAGGKKGKWRLVPLLSGTAGEGELSVDAETMLKNPETYSILPMDWDFLEEFIDPDHVTWKRNSFGFFVPAQMSLDAPEKIIMPFSEFLGQKSNKELEKIEIHVTDWKASKEFFEEKRKEVSNDLNMLAGETNSFPTDPEDCYVTTEVNIFPGLECKKRKRHIEDNGIDGQKYRLWKDASGKIDADMTPNEPLITDYPYKGGNFDAPVVMLENPLLDPTPPPLGLYIIGFDDAKQDTSSGDSVMSATIYKRNFEGGEWADRIVGWYDSRPDKKRDYYKTLHLLMKAFNARLLHENEDNGYVEFLEENYPDDLFIHVSTGVGLASEENLNRNHNRKWGWAPTPNNIYHANQKVVRYTKADGIVIGSQEGLSGVDRMNHGMLLQELYKYKTGKNADRLRSFSLCLTLAQYYDRTYQYQKNRKKLSEPGEKEKKKPATKGSKGLTDTSKLTKW